MSGVCPNCRAPTQSAARFCPQCGTALAVPGRGGADQRILTMAFVDLVGSTSLAAGRDLEGYDDVLHRFHDTVQEVFSSYGGTILQHYGDGVLACFGLRKDGEDAAVAGIAASLALRDDIPRQLDHARVRIGLHSGVVMCRTDAAGVNRPQITGLEVNIAARIQEQAAPGSVLASGVTLGFTHRIAEVKLDGSTRVTLKGVPEPMELCDIASVRFLGSRQDEATLFERDTPINTIIAGDAGSAFAVVGPPGIGKSTLAAELGARMGQTAKRVDIYARINLERSPLFPLADWLARFLGYADFPINPDQISDNPTHDLAGRLSAVPLQVPADHLAGLTEVLGLDDRAATSQDLSPPERRLRRIKALQFVLGSLMAGGPTLLQFDDFHWADADSRDVVEGLITQGIAPDSRMVLTARPSALVLDFAKANNLELIQLEPLSPKACKDMLADADLPDTTITQIIEASEGNPLFLKALLEAQRARAPSGTLSDLPLTIEATLQGIINDLDGLKEVVFHGAVIGRRFTLRQLQYVLPDRPRLEDELTYLQFNGILDRHDNSFAFGHILMRDSAYNMMPASRRKTLHGRFAAALMRDDPAFYADYPEILADHFLQAQDHENGVATCMAAGIKFLQSANFDLAVRYLTHSVHSVETLSPDDNQTDSLHVRALTLQASAQVQRFGFAHPVVLDSYAHLERKVSESHARSLDKMHALYGLFAQRMIAGNVRACRPMIDQMSTVADPDDPRQQILRWVNVSAYNLYSGRFDAALASSERVQDLYDIDDHGRMFLDVGADPLVSVLSATCHIQAQRGDLAGARASRSQALDHISRIGATLQMPWVHVFGAQAVFFAGAQDEARDEVARGIALADAQGGGFWSLNGRLWQAVFDSQTDPLGGGMATLEAMLPHAQAIGVELAFPMFWSVLAQAKLAQEDMDRALELSHKAVRRTARLGGGDWAPFVWQTRADVLNRARDPAAERAAAIAAAHIGRTRATIWQPGNQPASA